MLMLLEWETQGRKQSLPATVLSAGSSHEYPRRRSGHFVEMTSFLDLLSMTPILKSEIRFKWSRAIHLYFLKGGILPKLV